MTATAADREMVLRSFGETKTARAETPPPAAVEPTPAAVEPTPLIGNTWNKDAKSKEKEGETTPEVVDLSSASDTPPKKAPEKKPEEASENKIEYDKKAVRAAVALLKASEPTEDAQPTASDSSPDKKAPQQKPTKDEPAAAAAGPEAAPAAAPTGDIPYLGATGGTVLGGLEQLLGRLGWEGGQQKLQQWGQSPTARNIAGGTTATLGAIIAALAARKAFGGGDEGLEVGAGMKLSIVKKALMGQGVPALKDADGNNAKFGIPTRAGVATTHRNEIFDNLSKWSLGAAG